MTGRRVPLVHGHLSIFPGLPSAPTPGVLRLSVSSSGYVHPALPLSPLPLTAVACLTMRRASLLSRSALKRKLSTTASSSRLTLSAVEGPLEPPLVSKTLPAYFRDDILRAHGARIALIARQEQAHPHGGPGSRNLDDAAHLAWDFGEFDRHIQALARGLLDLGVKKGDRVGVIMGNNRCVAVTGRGAHLWRDSSFRGAHVRTATVHTRVYNGRARV